MSAHGDENTRETETGINEGSGENSIGFSRELLDDSIKTSFEPLLLQISANTEMMDRLIQSNSAKEATTASSRGAHTSMSHLTMNRRDPLRSQR